MAIEPFIGTVMMFGGNFAPRGWAMCNGQIMSIAQNTALFSLLGTQYGGNGQTTFGLPDLRGRVPLGQGQGPGLSSYSIGEQGGSEQATLLVTQLAAHAHPWPANADPDSAGTEKGGPGQVLARTGGTGDPPADPPTIYNTAAGAGVLDASSVSIVGGSQPHSLMAPSLGVTFVIATEGIFPSRN